MPKLKVALLIISDTAFKDPSTDKAGSILREVFQASDWDIIDVSIAPDEVLPIQQYIIKWADGENYVNAIVTTGGTGFAVKDNTPEAVEPLIHRHAPGLVHGMLSSSLAVTPFAMMSRPVAGVRNRTLIVTLPGSPKGAKENLEAIIKLFPHACVQAAGADSRAIHAGGVKQLEKEAGVEGPEKKDDAPPGHSHAHHHHHDHPHSHGSGGHTMPIAHTKPDDRPQQSNDPSAGPTRRYRKSPYPMRSVEEALNLISQHTPQPQVITLPVGESLIGYVLGEDVTASEAVPAFRASIVDGYAIRFPTSRVFDKGVYPISMISHAQAIDLQPLKEGEIARITTGAPLPPGADAVVMVEDTVLNSLTEDNREEKEVEILTSEVKRGENVREIGSDVKAGSVILKKGEGISAVGGELGLLASVGTIEVKVYKKPVVGILSTGDEIVLHDRKGELKLGEVRDTNRPTLLTAVRGSGFDTVDLGIISDKPGALETTLRESLRKVDVLITTGGVSMGELDLLKPTLERSLSGTIHFGRVSMKPGKPTTFATVPIKSSTTGARESKLVFSLPGNPASGMVTFSLFVLPSLHQWSGISPAGLPRVKVTIDEDIRCDRLRAEYVRAVVEARADGKLYAITTGGQRSSRIGSFKGANALVCLPVKDGVVERGELVDALIMGKLIGGL
ncbi:hypothetical protein EJ08DRAFT_630434 [Tothia fuscella]|uniref:MoaB/Mog domain-containing protein n=1 Tax=Tothia fuscella TaxID=1048955 RepID=A0A9P4NVV4_9PEZI|nr:hypothetical protein EJ08DRAFT_630434 [Tothia fuscella]